MLNAFGMEPIEESVTQTFGAPLPPGPPPLSSATPQLDIYGRPMPSAAPPNRVLAEIRASQQGRPAIKAKPLVRPSTIIALPVKAQPSSSGPWTSHLQKAPVSVPSATPSPPEPPGVHSGGGPSAAAVGHPVTWEEELPEDLMKMAVNNHMASAAGHQRLARLDQEVHHAYHELSG